MRAAQVILGVWAVAFNVNAQPLSAGAVSVAGAPTVSASGTSYTPLLSGDRRYVVFLSSARNLVTGDNLAPHLNVFRHDLLTEQTVLVPLRIQADSRAPTVSSNGEWIAFVSSSDIYAVNANSLSRSLVSADMNGLPPPNHLLTRNVPFCDNPHISADRRWVAFESFATNLTADLDLNNDSDVFLRDTLNNQTVLVSVAVDGGTTSNGKSEIVGLTPDGKYILFTSTATNLTATGPTNRHQELHVRDLSANTTVWVSPGDVPKPYKCRWPLMSQDGRFMLYKVESTGSTAAQIVLSDWQTGSNIVVTTSASPHYPIHMSPDGRFIAYDENGRVFLWDRQSTTRSVASPTGVNDLSHSPKVSDNGAIVAFISASGTTPYQIYLRDMASSQLYRITRTASGGLSGKDHQSSSVVVDPAGEFILFDSAEDDLVADDRNQASDVFVHRIATGETRLISRAHESRPAFTPVGAASVTNYAVSADGNRVLFFSVDSNLVPGDTNDWQDAFVRDLRTGRTFALTTNENGIFTLSNSVAHGVLSANGRFALLGVLHHLSAFSYPYLSILRKDLDSGATLTVMSDVRSMYQFPFSTPFFAFSLSADGRWATYPSNNLIIVADMQTGVQTNLTPGDHSWTEPVISGDGRYVMYAKASSPRTLAITDLTTGERIELTNVYVGGKTFTLDGRSIVYGTAIGPTPAINVYSLVGRTNTLVCTNCWNPQPSADGRFVAYQTIATPYQVHVTDMQTQITTLVTRNIHATGGGNADAMPPVISGDGRFVAYVSKATNLTTDVPNGWGNLYVYDRLQGTTVRVTGERGNMGYGSGSASRPVLGPDGRTLVFQSFASDFVANDFNDTRDVFVLKLGESDSDNDGMSDSWEQTHFNTTERDGTRDFDEDGQSDLAEYLAGTNPSDGQSVFEVLTITSASTGQVRLVWRAEPGKWYRLEYKPDLQGAGWTALGEVVLASEPTAFAIDATAAGSEKRFYRVALVQ
jgi:Tol biopolymer transport system component